MNKIAIRAMNAITADNPARNSLSSFNVRNAKIAMKITITNN